MTTAYTSLLGFALPVPGELDGTWGTTVNNSITQLAEDAIAATATQSVTSADWTLTTTGSGAANQARCAILVPTGSPGVTRNIVAPSSSKAYVVDNKSNAAVVVKGSATTGTTIAAGARALVAWTGTDFVTIATSTPDGVTSVSGTGTVQGLTLSGTVTSTGSLTLGGSLSAVSLTSQVSGILPIANGGTNASDAATARSNLSVPSTTGSGASGTWGIDITGNAATATNGVVTTGSYANPTWITSLAGSKITGNISGNAANVTGVVAVANGGTGLSSTPANGALDIGNGTGFTRATLTAGSGVTITNTAGGITIAATGSGGTITSVTASSPLSSSGGTTPNITFSGILAVANGGTGASDAATARSNLSVPSTSGSGATGTWGINISGNAATATSATTANNVSGTVAIANGGTGSTTASGARTALDVPSTSGSGALGTWGINISGNAATATAAGTATSATSAASLSTTNFTVTQVGTKLVINYNGTPVLSIDSSGNLVGLNNVTAYGTP